MTEKLPCCENHDVPPVDKPVAVKKIAIGFLVFVAIATGWWQYRAGLVQSDYSSAVSVRSGDFALPLKWGDLGIQMAEAGVIDAPRMIEMYQVRGGAAQAEELLTTTVSQPIMMTDENTPLLLNMLWAFGLANKNAILEAGPMAQYGETGNLASTGGWTLAVGNPMDHYSRHGLVPLTSAQQEMVERMAKRIYRPCCENATHFPDCNHGMAMLGLLELMAAQGMSEAEMYKVALKVNTYWFPDTYETIAQYLQETGRSWETVPSQELLGEKFSSGSGARQVAVAYEELVAQKEAAQREGSSPVAPASRSSGGCGV